MKNSPTIKTLMLATALALGLGANVRADDSQSADASTAGDYSLLGQKHGTLTYGYTDLDGTSVHADSYTLAVNEPLAFGLDGIFAYDYTRAGAIAGSSSSLHTISAALRAFSSSFNWGKPYVEGGVGHVWSRFGGARDTSFMWEVAVGAEFKVAPRATVTPYVQYADAPDLAGSGVWNFGVRGSYWIDNSWAVTAGFKIDDDQNSTFTVGTNFRF
jgi:hypothetical protein